jgi:hypothetical protein
MHGAIPPLPQYTFMAWFLVKNRDNFTVTFYTLYRLMDCYYLPLMRNESNSSDYFPA